MSQSFDLYNPTEAHLELRNNIARFSKARLDEQAKENDEQESFNHKLFSQLAGELGLLGVTVPEKDGGLGLDPVAAVIIHEEMSKYDPGFTLSYLAHEVLFVNNLNNSANAEQKKRYLPRVISGEWIAGMGMTEPGAGTDVLGMSTLAVKKGNKYILNGTKQYITNGNIGSVFLVYAKMDSKDNKKTTAFIVESGFPGFSVGKKEEKLGMRASPTTQLIFEDMEVPEENLIGEENGAIGHMMRNLEIERVTLAAQSLGIALRSIEIMCDYAIRHREAFGKKLSEFGQMQRLIAESYADCSAARALVYEVASKIHPSSRNSLGAASAKLVATRMAETVSRNAIQVLGGYGYCREYPIERLHRDSILLSIGGGTNEAMQKNIIADLKKFIPEMGLKVEEYLEIQGGKLYLRFLNRNLMDPEKPFLLFLHEGLGSVEQWKTFPERLCEEACLPGVLYDRFGHGKSAPFLKKREIDYLEIEAFEILPQVLNQLPSREVIFIGHSDGASIALLFASRFPDRVRAVISESAHIYCEELTRSAIREVGFAYLMTDLGSRLERYHGDKTVDLFHAWHDTWLTEEFKYWSIESFMENVVCPVLLMQGKNDQYFASSHLEDLALELKNAKVQKKLIDKCQHVPHFEKRKEVLDIILHFLESENLFPKKKPC